MPKNPLKDYIWVIEKLMKSPLTLSELQKYYYQDTVNDDHKELQAKTFYNWRGKINDIFNIKIEYVGDKYEIVEADEPQRKAALDWLVQSMSLNTALSHSRDLSKRILLEDIPSGETYLQPIIKCLDMNDMENAIGDNDLGETIVRLTRDIEEISRDIQNLRGSFPFNLEKDLLDPVWVNSEQAALKEERSQLEKQKAMYAERLELLTL